MVRAQCRVVAIFGHLVVYQAVCTDSDGKRMVGDTELLVAWWRTVCSGTCVDMLKPDVCRCWYLVEGVKRDMRPVDLR